MNWIDIVALATILLLVSLGFRRGLIKEVGSLLAVLLALTVSLLFVVFGSRALPRVAPFPQRFLPWVVALLVFLVLLFLLQVVFHLIHRAVHSTPLGFLDRLGGAGFGGLKGLAAIGFVLLILSLLPLPGAARTQLQDSLLYEAVSSLRPKLVRLTIRSVKRSIERKAPLEEETGSR